jgi:hypothetical protein
MPKVQENEARDYTHLGAKPVESFVEIEHSAALANIGGTPL